MSLTMTLVLSLCLVLIEGARQNTVRLEAECIVDIALNSVLAEYHREVLERYNLFYIDSSYGTKQPSYYNTEANLRKYVEKNISVRKELGWMDEDGLLSGVYLDLLKLEFPLIRITGVELATDNGGYTFQKQAIQAAGSDFGIGVLDKILDWIRVVEEKSLLTNKVEEEIANVENQLSALQGKEQLEDHTWVTIPVENPVTEITGERRKGLLKWVAGSISEVSEKAIVPEQYISARRREGQINQGNINVQGKMSLYEKLLFQEYLFRYAGNYLNIRSGSGLDYQIEYLLFGDAADMDNLRQTAAAICGLRETANILYLLTSSEKMEMISTVSSVLSAALLVPEAEPVLEGIILIAWSCLESLRDTEVLLKGGKVPLLKDDTSWKSDLDSVLDFHVGSADEEAEQGLSYEDYLRIFLYFCDLETVTYRFMDIMEMDIRLTEGNQYFRMDSCIDYLETAVTAESEYGCTYQLKHAKGYR